MSDSPNVVAPEARSFGRAPVDSSVMRAQNSGLLVQMIWAERMISRVEISRRTGLSPSTVSLIVNMLSASGLVREMGTTTSARGRRPTQLSFCDDVFNIVGVELGIRHVAVALTDLRGQVKAFRSERHEMRDGPEGAIALMRDLINECVKEARVARRKLMGIGVAVPSPINQAAPGVLSERLYPAWAEYDIQKALEKSLRLPVFIDNDANLGALAEHWWGAGVGFQDLAYIKIGGGLGSGHVLRGEVYRGASGAAGEIGHVSIDPAGPQCVCGARGCITMYVGSDALVERCKKLFKDKRFDIAELLRRAELRDPRAVALLEEVAGYLGQVISGSIVNLMNPAVIVLGGEITGAGSLLLEPLRQFVRERAWNTSLDTARIVTSTLGPRAIAVGAATLYLDEALRHPERFLLAEAAE